MQQLILATLAFVGTHLVMSHPLRKPMVAVLRPAGFQIVYSLISLGCLVWMVMAYRAIGPEAPFWIAPGWVYSLVNIVMLFAAILLAGSFFANPAMPTPDAVRNTYQNPRGVFAITRHPMMWSIILWGVTHMVLMPSDKDFWLAGGVAFLAFFGSLGQDLKKARVMGLAWVDWRNKTSFWPFANQLKNSNWHLILPPLPVLALGIVLWLGLTWLHVPSGIGAVGPWTVLP